MVRRVLSALGGGVLGLVGGILIPLLFLGLYAGGVSYRKECDDGGVITKDWSFSWFPPIPYVFRPDDPRCIVHSGTRVALSAVGIGTFERTTPELIAKKFAPEAPNAQAAYFVRARAVLTRFVRSVDSADTISKSQNLVRRTRDDLARLRPTRRYASVHNGLVRVFGRVLRTGEEVRRALQGRDRARLLRLTPVLRRQDREARALLTEFNRLHAAE